MKTLKTCILICLLFSSISCKKETLTVSLNGTWELRSIQADSPLQLFPAGSGNILTFSGNSYQQISNGSTIKSGTFVIKNDTSFNSLVVPAGEFENIIIYDNNTAAEKVFIQLSGNTLTLISGQFAIDSGVKKVYERIEL